MQDCKRPSAFVHTKEQWETGKEHANWSVWRGISQWWKKKRATDSNRRKAMERSGVSERFEWTNRCIFAVIFCQRAERSGFYRKMRSCVFADFAVS